MWFYIALGMLILGSALAFSSPEERIQRRAEILKNDRTISPQHNGPVAPDTASDCEDMVLRRDNQDADSKTYYNIAYAIIDPASHYDGIAKTVTNSRRTPTTRPATSTKPTTTGNGVSTPLSMQPGMVTNCNKFHFINQGRHRRINNYNNIYHDCNEAHDDYDGKQWHPDSAAYAARHGDKL
ncbi:hypothetical protein TW65_02198 [Stemphylium lycopersici]|uniref:Carbohydrate-binding module family 50 protein n=1 Tax=Stemphylium lycopersici TaxID=183478 RepID=A0A364MRI8_STELY|nr:hypothetical protein TW65_02198 [Stemphylium lycopersici]RAR00487.1 carbohydrate-binding module family 50 protein [Stemphylium lycopersici]